MNFAGKRNSQIQINCVLKNMMNKWGILYTDFIAFILYYLISSINTKMVPRHLVVYLQYADVAICE